MHKRQTAPTSFRRKPRKEKRRGLGRGQTAQQAAVEEKCTSNLQAPRPPRAKRASLSPLCSLLWTKRAFIHTILYKKGRRSLLLLPPTSCLLWAVEDEGGLGLGVQQDSSVKTEDRDSHSQSVTHLKQPRAQQDQSKKRRRRRKTSTTQHLLPFSLSWSEPRKKKKKEASSVCNVVQ